MGTTAAARSKGGPSTPGPASRSERTPVRIGVLWDYPFSLVRRLAIAFVALFALCIVATWALTLEMGSAEAVLQLIPAVLAIVASLYIAELIGVTERPMPRLKVEALFAAIGISCLVMGVLYLIVPDYAPRAELLCAAPALAALSVYLQRRWIEVRGGTTALPAAVFAGTREQAARALQAIKAIPGLEAKAVVLASGVEDRTRLNGLKVYAPTRDLHELRADGIRMLVVGGATDDELRSILVPCAGAGYIVESVADLAARCQGRTVLDSGHDLRLLARLTSQARPYATQRAVDLVIASTLLVLSLPLWPFVALLVKLTSKGPVFFRQQRVGHWGKTFTILKFRTMHADAEAESGPVWSQPGDTRVTSVGPFLRASRLDELPQLWTILKGDMSVVGPRPERPYFVQTLRAKIPLYDARHSVRPGLTGWAQIRYAYGSTEEAAEEKLEYDLFYILNRSLTFYAAVLLETAKVLVFRRGGR